MLETGGPEEVGRELLAHELVERTVVVLAKAGRPMVTQWVEKIGKDYVIFQAASVCHLLLQRNPDGTLEDDDRIQIKVYEFLGKV